MEGRCKAGEKAWWGNGLVKEQGSDRIGAGSSSDQSQSAIVASKNFDSSCICATDGPRFISDFLTLSSYHPPTMRRVKIFSGTSHPALTEAICERLGNTPAKCVLKKFSNGETSVDIGTSVRDQDVFIVQSGSRNVNDSVMELLIMINACKGGSAKSVTAVMPYFPYSRQSKKKSHRGAITARMLANLLGVAGVSHIITVDLHASQMQGFFGQPVDNLIAEPLIARWIRTHVSNWKDAMVVSKNAGGTKRVTSLADALKLKFGMVTAHRKKPYPNPMADNSLLLNGSVLYGEIEVKGKVDIQIDGIAEENHFTRSRSPRQRTRAVNGSPRSQLPHRLIDGESNNVGGAASKLPERPRTPSSPRTRLQRAQTAPSTPIAYRSSEDEASGDESMDEQPPRQVTGRFIHGHIVDDDHPSPALSALTNSTATLPPTSNNRTSERSDSPANDPMASSFLSTVSSLRTTGDHALGGTFDAVAATSEDEEEGFKNPVFEHTITLVGDVRDRTVFIVDDMIDKSGSWIAAAETVRKRGGAKAIYCMATHGLFGGDCLDEMEKCDCIDKVVVTNSFPISEGNLRRSSKLVVLDLSNLLAEAIRRNHHGESISALFQHYDY
ncbi:MAG: hypothetical protein M1834_008640 [Cirrosporium novae-zelandiae]|nr:MAG: hypothetical protein M1834_008640 [Cirrosporium novae-zelandiae]